MTKPVLDLNPPHGYGKSLNNGEAMTNVPEAASTATGAAGTATEAASSATEAASTATEAARRTRKTVVNRHLVGERREPSGPPGRSNRDYRRRTRKTVVNHRHLVGERREPSGHRAEPADRRAELRVSECRESSGYREAERRMELSVSERREPSKRREAERRAELRACERREPSKRREAERRAEPGAEQRSNAGQNIRSCSPSFSKNDLVNVLKLLEEDLSSQPHTQNAQSSHMGALDPSHSMERLPKRSKSSVTFQSGNNNEVTAREPRYS
ncbi:hypothetical protein RR48_09357 [Papilio machaon]|uniref:Uncharacterized protein n=1 Tax=Papilio machaon TaxID=76193 RepID=A0A194RDH2_PAPMA|nr:hypothetical protein RR48_09357 [Papilio machaon]